MTDHPADDLARFDAYVRVGAHVPAWEVAELVAEVRKRRATLARVRAFVQHWHEDPGASLVERSATGRVLALLDGAR